MFSLHRATDKQVFFVFLAFRLLGVLIVRSSFVPDEFWQSLEVSHLMTYGYGHLTWEWDKKIRSCCYPFVFHIIYKMLPDSPLVVIHLPRILQSVLSSIGDFFAYKLASEYFGKKCGLWTVLNILISWFLFYCSPRTLTNMAETSLTSCGLYFYPWPKIRKHRSSSKYLWFAGGSVLMRPTAIVTWFPLYVWHIWRDRNIFLLLKRTCFIGLTILVGMLLIDKWCYGQWVFAHYNFFLFNWTNDIGAFYGSHGFLWYYIIGLPTILGIQVIPFMLGIFLHKLQHFYFLILWVLIIFSIPSHKEFRFLLPILHLCLIICGVVMDEIWSERFHMKVKKKHGILFLALLTLINIPFITYMSLFHQRGVVDAALHLSKTVDTNSSVLFLMPCHSTPYYSYIHRNIEMKFLSCEPNFENEEGYLEEADEFFGHPVQWLSKNYERKDSKQQPSHIVIFDSVYPDISEFLRKYSYKKCFSAFHSHFAQGRTGKYVYIYCK